MEIYLKPASEIKAKFGIQPNGRVQAFFTNACYKAMDRYVPMDKGNLRTIVYEGHNYIIYESPYARYQYYGVREDGTHKVMNYTTPGTGPYWDKKMWTAKGDDIIEQVKKEMKRGGY